jgi:hypothetical protein
MFIEVADRTHREDQYSKRLIVLLKDVLGKWRCIVLNLCIQLDDLLVDLFDIVSNLKQPEQKPTA